MRPGAPPRFEAGDGLVGLMNDGRAREAPASPPSASSGPSSLLARRSNDELEKAQRDLRAAARGCWPRLAGEAVGRWRRAPDEAHEELLLRLAGERNEAAGGGLGALGRRHQEEFERAALQRVEQLGLLLRARRAALAERGDDCDERLAERGIERRVADGAVALGCLRRRRDRHVLPMPRDERRDDAARLMHDDRCK